MADDRRLLPRLSGLDGYTRTRLGFDHERRYGSGPRAAPALPAGDAALAVLHHEFIRTDGPGPRSDRDEQHAARVCWDQMHKEYALAELSRWREGKVGLRWRTEAEVLAGKGQFQCGSLSCDGVLALHSYELPFRYAEHGVQKEALVKVRVCGSCAPKLFGRTASSAAGRTTGAASEPSQHVPAPRDADASRIHRNSGLNQRAPPGSRRRASSRSRSPPQWGDQRGERAAGDM